MQRRRHIIEAGQWLIAERLGQRQSLWTPGEICSKRLELNKKGSIHVLISQDITGFGTPLEMIILSREFHETLRMSVHVPGCSAGTEVCVGKVSARNGELILDLNRAATVQEEDTMQIGQRQLAFKQESKPNNPDALDLNTSSLHPSSLHPSSLHPSSLHTDAPDGTLWPHEHIAFEGPIWEGAHLSRLRVTTARIWLLSPGKTNHLSGASARSKNGKTLEELEAEPYWGPRWYPLSRSTLALEDGGNLRLSALGETARIRFLQARELQELHGRLKAANLTPLTRRETRSSAQYRPELIRQVWQRFAGQCACCASTHELEIDHIIPRAKGGSSNVTNLQLLCGKCNRIKGASI